MTCSWKSNWEQTRKHYINWWNHEGLVIHLPNVIAPHPVADVQKPEPPTDFQFQHTDSNWIAKRQRYRLSRGKYLGDTIPIAAADIGYQTLSLYLGGSKPVFREDTVWYEPLMGDINSVGKLIFDPSNPWFQNHVKTYEETVATGKNLFFTGTPGLGSNIDVLSAMRGPEAFMLDLIERPEWVKKRLKEINQAYFQAFESLYNIYKLADGSSCASYYGWWSPGKVALVMSEAAAMISPDMFKEFVVPFMEEQCHWLDHSVFLIDGKECLRFLEHLLAIDDLDAIAFDTGPHGQDGDDPVWFDLYKKILKAGKSVQIYGSHPAKALPLLNNIGSAGVNLVYNGLELKQAEDFLVQLESYYQTD